MAGCGRFVIALLAGLMFFSCIPLATAQNEQPELQIVLDTELDEIYLEGDELILNVKIVNQGDIYTISNDPSCDFYFTIFDDGIDVHNIDCDATKILVGYFAEPAVSHDRDSFDGGVRKRFALD